MVAIIKPVTHVIFDLDGLLIDSESAYVRIIGGIAQQYGKEYTKEIQLKVLGTYEPDTVRIAIEEMQLPITGEEFLKQLKEGVARELQRPPLMPGALELVQHLSKHNILIAVATSSSYEAMKRKTQTHETLFKLFLHIVCGSSDPEVKKGKPAPDVFLVCASRFPDKPDPKQCLVFEDAPNGVRAAVSAGMQAVMVPADEPTDEIKSLCSLILKSLDEFKPELFGLPPRDA